MTTHHQPVMLNEVLEGLTPPADGTILDATLGMGGHTTALLKAMGPAGRVIALDRDADSLTQARAALAGESRVTFVHSNYDRMAAVLRDLGIDGVDGILIDAGISSFQLDDAGRGFSWDSDGPLDMRMNRGDGPDAAELLNTLSEHDLIVIIREYGEERFARRIARRIVEEREREPFARTGQLRDVVLRSLPGGYRRQRRHPATRTFQALRIAVNRELESLQAAVEQAVGCLRPGGRIAVIAFHSLEDRIVKNCFRECHKQRRLHILTKKPLRPTAEETSVNPRSRSARLRVAERPTEISLS